MFEDYCYSDLKPQISDFLSPLGEVGSVKILFEAQSQFDERIEDVISQCFEPVALKRVSVSEQAFYEKVANFDDVVKYIFDYKISSFFMIDKDIWSAIEQIIADKKSDLSQREKDISTRFKVENKFISDYFRLEECFNKHILFVDIS